jgi:hypothetical protein
VEVSMRASFVVVVLLLAGVSARAAVKTETIEY